MPNLLQRLARLKPYMKNSWGGLIAALLAAAVTAATEGAIPKLLQYLLDDGFASSRLPLWAVPTVLIALFAVRSASAFVAQYGLAWVANRAVLLLREHMFVRVLAAAPTLFTSSTASGMTNTLVYEAQTGVQLLTGSVLTLARDSLILVVLLVILLVTNWQLTLIVALLFPAIALVVRVLGRRLHRLTVEGQAATDSLAYVVEENVLAWRIVRLHGAEAHQGERFFERANRVRRLMLKAVVAGATLTPVTQMLAACALSVVITLALWQSRAGHTSVGQFVAFVSALLQRVAPAKHLSDVMSPMTRGLAAVERGLDLVDDTPVESGGSFDGGRARGEIRYSGVSLRYRDDGLPAVDDLSLQVHAGETVALVGPSGAGKTTLVNLLPRFIEPGAGTITLD
ncbi:MAG: ATP-binding cassette domain-containing protein, partial [Burkholderiales bacterium]|nr:ATP-binding cassette domain-containing protein [Burkholderiales bacterium]